MNSQKLSVLFLLVICLGWMGCPKDKEEIINQPLLLSCHIDSDMRLTDRNPAGVDYIVECEVDINNGLLTIDPGVTIEFKTDAALSVTDKGAISINGTIDKPVILKGAFGQASWAGIYIETNDPRNAINY